MPVSTRLMNKKSSLKETAHSAQLKWFLVSAWNSYDSSTMSLSSWAREEARRFHHELNKDVKFAEVYETLMDFAKEMASISTPSYELSTNTKADAAMVKVIVEDGEMTDAEERLARKKLNAILHSEYNNWWDSFVLEESEDTSADASSASDRFSYHCARIISRKTGIRDEVIAPVVGAWLIQKASTTV